MGVNFMVWLRLYYSQELISYHGYLSSGIRVSPCTRLAWTVHTRTVRVRRDQVLQQLKISLPSISGLDVKVI